MKKIHLILIFIITFGCASHKAKKNYEITESATLTLNQTDSIKVNELRFTPNFSATDLQKFLFRKYGKWNSSIKTDKKQDVLVWENIQLLETSDELFTIAASGKYKKFETIKVNGNQKYGRIFYCSAIVVNSKNFDCLQSSSKLKDSLVTYLMNGVKSVNEKDELFEKEISTN